jgi:hypothetical protein
MALTQSPTQQHFLNSLNYATAADFAEKGQQTRNQLFIQFIITAAYFPM